MPRARKCPVPVRVPNRSDPIILSANNIDAHCIKSLDQPELPNDGGPAASLWSEALVSTRMVGRLEFLLW